jgi:hypothetical protein
MGRGALGVAQRPVPLHLGSAECGIDRRCEIADATMWSDRVVIVLPDCQLLAGVSIQLRCAPIQRSTVGPMLNFGILRLGSRIKPILAADKLRYTIPGLDFGYWPNGFSPAVANAEASNRCYIRHPARSVRRESVLDGSR